jgi:hypothetical protein
MKFNDLTVKRYSDAYKFPKSLLEIGSNLKRLGIGVGFFVLLVGICCGDFGGFLLALTMAGFFSLISIGLGVIVSAHGQTLCASLDTAVNTSPFLSAQERADVMSLSPQRSWDAIGINSISPANVKENGAEKTTDHQLPKYQNLSPIESPVAALIAEAQMVEAARSPRSGRRPSRFAGRRWY